MPHTPSAGTREDLNSLFENVAEQAKQRRLEFEDLIPFGMTLGAALLDGSARAAIIAYEGKVYEARDRQVDALLFDLEHQDDETIRLYADEPTMTPFALDAVTSPGERVLRDKIIATGRSTGTSP